MAKRKKIKKRLPEGLREEMALQREARRVERAERKLKGDKAGVWLGFKRWAEGGSLFENLELRKFFVAKDRFRENFWFVMMEADGQKKLGGAVKTYLITFSVEWIRSETVFGVRDTKTGRWAAGWKARRWPKRFKVETKREEFFKVRNEKEEIKK